MNNRTDHNSLCSYCSYIGSYEFIKRIHCRILVMVGLIVLNCSLISAQTHYKAQISFGAHGGVDLSRVLFTPSVTQQFLPGANAGLNFRYCEEKHFGFMVEANFEQRGWKDDFEGEPFSYQRTVNYIQIPFLSHIYFGKRGRFFINLGPSISFKVGESTKSNFDYNNVASIPNFPVHTSQQYGYKTKAAVDYGIQGGLGGEFSINKKNAIFIEARYYFGLANLLSSKRTDHFRGSNQMTLSINLGYWLRLK